MYIQCDHILENNQLTRKQMIAKYRNSRSSTKTLMERKEKKKRVFLEGEMSNWLCIWTAASSLDVKGNKAIKKKIYSR